MFIIMAMYLLSFNDVLVHNDQNDIFIEKPRGVLR
jgi:hypothetical protein